MFKNLAAFDFYNQMFARGPAIFFSAVYIIKLDVLAGCGSGIRCLFDPWIRDRFFPDPRPQTHIF
jgi:hypothetical protein